MLKHMLTPASPGPRAPPVDLLGVAPPPRHPHRLHHPSQQQLNLSLASHHSGRLNHSHLSTLSTSKHSLGGNSSSVSPGTVGPLSPMGPLGPLGPTKLANGGLHLAPPPVRRPAPSAAPASREPSPSGGCPGGPATGQPGVREMMTSLGLLCLVSLLLALLALIFLLKISPAERGSAGPPAGPELGAVTLEEYVVVYEVTLALCALTLSLNLCCLLVCAIQFLFAVKLARTPHNASDRTNKYLQKSSVTRMCAVGGFFVSIPVFLTGIILYTFIQFHSTPAIITSVFIGLGIIFCGCAMVHNVFVWQREKTNAVKALAQQRQLSVSTSETTSGGTDSRALHLSLRQDTPLTPGSMPAATLDLSGLVLNPHELSTLV